MRRWGHLGGAATKIRHWLRLLHKEADFTVILTQSVPAQEQAGEEASWLGAARAVLVLLNLFWRERHCVFRS